MSTQTTQKFNPPFKRLNQTELLNCLQHGWTGRLTLIPAVKELKAGAGKYARMEYNLANHKEYVSCMVYPTDSGHIYRQVDYPVVAALEKKGVIVINYQNGYEATFALKGD